MKKYTVIVTPEAESGIVAAFDYIRQHSLANARKWLVGLYGRIDSLEQMPGRCGLAREHEYFDAVVRQLVFKSHRIIFRIEETSRIVRVLYLRHASQRTIGEPDEDEAG